MLKNALRLVASAAPLLCSVGAASASDLSPTGTAGFHADACQQSAANSPTYVNAVQADCGAGIVGRKTRPTSSTQPHTTSAPGYVSCSYNVPAGFVPSMYTNDRNGTPSGPLVKVCVSSPTPVDNSMASDPQMTIPILIPKPSPPPSLASLAQSAAANLHLAPPAMRLSPGLDKPQVVNVPAWYFLDPASWAPVSSSVAAGAVTVTVTATPVSVTWTSGDGGSVTCAGPGTPYPVEDPNPPAQSPTCGHAFTRASAGFPDGVYPLTAQVSWQIGWRASTGVTGTLPPTATSATAQVRVVEVQALVTGVRS